MPKINVLPADDNTNGWSRILPNRTPKPPLQGTVRADWVVIGAGFAGLAAARRLAENRPNDKIIVLEAQEAGEGASGRNSGFAIDLPHNVGSSMEELEASHRYLRLARAGINYHRQQIERHGIACDWSPVGKYHAAVSEQGVKEVLEPTVKELDRLGEPYTWYDKAALREKLGSPHFTAAVYTPGTVLLNPAALTRGLADSLPENVTLYEHTPVIEVDYRNGVTLTTRKGSVYAPVMILGVNGFAEQFGFYKGRLLTFAAHASLSRRLTAAEYQALGSIEPWGLTPANAFAGITMRLTPDHRILIRQNVHFCPSFRQSDERRRKIQAEHKRLLDERFPMLPNVDMEHTWTGYICLSRNGAPGFGRAASNVYTAVCQNAVGVAKGTISGLLAADMACGVDNSLIPDMQSLGTPSRVPPRPFLDIGVRTRFAWELRRARHEA
jgi:glycine/D-amino acid oxidase-like deaminating enzyme